MKVIDLTHTIESNMPVFPGTEPPTLEKVNTLEKDGYAELKISIYTHIGTHMDAPAHMLKGAPTLDNFDANQFIGKAMILDFTNSPGKRIEVEDLRAHETQIQEVDFLLFKTGWSKFWGMESYFGGFPSLTAEAAQWLTAYHLKGTGIDAISMDAMDTTSFDVHKILLGNNILLIENLTNLEAIRQPVFLLSILPLKIKEADGSPIRAAAIEGF